MYTLTKYYTVLLHEQCACLVENILLLFFSSTSITFFFHSSKVGMSSLPGTGGSVPPSGSATYPQHKTTFKQQFNSYMLMFTNKSRIRLYTDGDMKMCEISEDSSPHVFCMAKSLVYSFALKRDAQGSESLYLA